MKTIELFKKKTVFSYEVFPPKRNADVSTIYETLAVLKNLGPDFISVTYGAGGGENGGKTFQIASAIKKDYGIESVAHLSGIGHTKAEIRNRLDELRSAGIENILALRGDMPQDGYTAGDFPYACDLISYMKEHGDFHVIAACYPEGHIETNSKAEDIRNLKTKVDAGADQLISQLFFDNDYFYSFMERCRSTGITVPVEAGIMPVVNKKQMERMTLLCGASVPKKLAAMMDRYGNDPASMRDAGIAYAIDQIADLIAQGVEGIHLYTMNQPYISQKIYEATHHLLEPRS